VLLSKFLIKNITYNFPFTVVAFVVEIAGTECDAVVKTYNFTFTIVVVASVVVVEIFFLFIIHRFGGIFHYNTKYTIFFGCKL
jgi:hypothetical protein